ncbi:hypothetical protein ACI65C_010373 [Semiaphis heraclei]
MPFPPPPPPPPTATLPGPPPPPPPAFGAGPGKKGGNPLQARDQLLQSIRLGKPLKKTVTNDKSSPLINRQSRTQTPPTNNSSPVQLFNQSTANHSPSNTSTLPSQKKNDGIRKIQNDIKSRGPPPQPPPFNQKPNIPSSTSEPVSIIPPGVGHNLTGSVPSLVSDNVTGRGPPPGGYGKPNVAPKPPSIRPAVPTKKSTLTVSSTNLVAADGRNLVSRAQSMRIPKTPPVAPNSQPPQFNNMTISSKNQLPAFHQSQDSILRSSPNPPPNGQWGSRTLRPIKHPSTRPPPPPIKAPLNPPLCAPPPPPPHRSGPPPPPPNVPPHKSYQNNNVTNGAPPTPPTRHSSMRNGPTSVLSMSLLEEMEMKFSTMFKPMVRIPSPPIFQRVDKIYNSRLVVAKHQAPKPPGY